VAEDQAKEQLYDQFCDLVIKISDEIIDTVEECEYEPEKSD